ncbi:helix-turn-helix domain-containing protein [Staphylococcus agnetis]|uniref:helix-turn-helix domain-containing protein n=1 Tax=Staphylococcus agnetis TaxID=985762 RepID=UPI00208E63D0|nr:helix-turn-helix transcriptional regulator [Staphylococcus agnetis]MCO4326116.1 helix-turn-helix domain-containing protein [Staphylococcus agnetis]MCO4356951.1 helix-turn-helix domain-containing protein [Staphylococcus agnetis]
MEYKSARKILSENLEQLMKERNITQVELSEAISVSQSTVSNWLKESKYPRISKIQELADYFNVPKSRITEENTLHQGTLAAHLDGDFTDEELREILEYAEFVKQKHRNK